MNLLSVFVVIHRLVALLKQIKKLIKEPEKGL